MKKVIIIGSPGAGKSTFARKLRDVIGLPLYHLDLIWHLPDKTNVAREEFDARLQEILNRGEWIIDGNYTRTIEARLKCCDTVFLLDMPLDVCISGAMSRVGKRHDDLPWVEDEFDPEFRQWIEDFPRDTLPKIYSLIEQYKADKDVVIFKSRDEADAYIESFARP